MRCRRDSSIPASPFPICFLLVSGGHCQLLLVKGVGDYRRLATTIDDAAGEAFDKTAKLLGLGYPGGPAVERIAQDGNPHAVPLPRPLAGSAEPHFSFAGLKSAVARAAATGAHSVPDLAASFQQAVVDCLVDRSRIALAACPDATAFVVAGGVAANSAIRAALTDLAARFDRPFVAPPLWLCTDNGAMIALGGRPNASPRGFSTICRCPRARAGRSIPMRKPCAVPESKHDKRKHDVISKFWGGRRRRLGGPRSRNCSPPMAPPSVCGRAKRMSSPRSTPSIATRSFCPAPHCRHR